MSGQPRRGVFGQLVKWAFILFNVLIVYFIITEIGGIMDAIGDVSGAGQTEDELEAKAVLIAFGGFFAAIWIVLGLLTLVTRPRRRR